MAPREGLFWRESRTEIESLESDRNPEDCRKIRKKPVFCVAARHRLLRITYCGQFPNQTEKLREPDSNRRPRGYEPRELPGCSTPRQDVNFRSLAAPPQGDGFGVRRAPEHVVNGKAKTLSHASTRGMRPTHATLAFGSRPREGLRPNRPQRKNWLQVWRPLIFLLND